MKPRQHFSIYLFLVCLSILCGGTAVKAETDTGDVRLLATPVPLIVHASPVSAAIHSAATPEAAPIVQFASPITFPFTYHSSPVIQDFTGDGKPDVLIAGHIFGNTGTAQLHDFGQALPITGETVIAVADFTSDGKADIITNNDTTGVATLWRNVYPAQPMFVTSNAFTQGEGFLSALDDLTVADVMGNHRPDLVYLQGGDAGTSIEVVINDGGIFRRAITTLTNIPHEVFEQAQLFAGDFNHDGKQDIAFFFSNDPYLYIALSKGNGTFARLDRYTLGQDSRDSWLQDIAIGDLNGDGRDDIAAMHYIAGVDIFLSNADGTLSPGPQSLGSSLYPKTVALADFNHDGTTDVLWDEGEQLYVALNTGAAHFRDPITPAGDFSNVEHIATADVDADGWSDLLTEESTAEGHALFGVYINNSYVPLMAYADFLPQWAWADKPLVVGKSVGRGYLWGPPVFNGTEYYAPHAGYRFLTSLNQRLVQYFDKGRMEEPPRLSYYSPPGAVTYGLLVKELVTGRAQYGDDVNLFTQGQPSEAQIAGDPNTNGQNAISPTYRSFKDVATFNGDHPVAEQHGQPVTQRMAKDGTVSTMTPPAPVTLTTYDAQTHHNIADVFVRFMQTQGVTYSPTAGYTTQSIFSPNATAVIGLPITEPYWVRTVVAGHETDVLVQLFERRVLTYEPGAPTAYQVQMGNVGQHYYRWRYQDNLGQNPPS